MKQEDLVARAKEIADRKRLHDIPYLIPGMDRAIVAFTDTPGGNKAIYDMMVMADIYYEYSHSMGVTCSDRWAQAKMYDEYFLPDAPWLAHINPANMPIFLQWGMGEVSEDQLNASASQASEYWDAHGVDGRVMTKYDLHGMSSDGYGS